MTYSEDGFYYQKNGEGNKFYRYTDGEITTMNVPQAKKCMLMELIYMLLVILLEHYICK